MKTKVNAYFASLLITVLGAWATMTIVRVAYSNTIIVTYASVETR